MEIGTQHVAKLEPFLLMSKAAKGAAAAKLIQDATSAPGVFVFGELLDLPNIQELATHETHSRFYSLLQLFAYKTYADYIQHKDSLPPLNDAQTIKLKQLTLVSLAQDSRILPYNELLRVLDMPTVRELEDLIIDAIYLDIVRGKLDQKEGQFEIEYTMGRDLEPGKLEQLLVSLQNWCVGSTRPMHCAKLTSECRASTTAAVLATLDNKLSELSNRTVTAKTMKEEYDRGYQSTLKEVVDKQKEARNANKTHVFTGRSGLTPAGRAELQREQERQQQRERELRGKDNENDENSMDIDEPAEGSKGKGRK
ncbi:COP9 signalosome complex subunit 7a [Trametes pubescens]|uniref:COP9 signalosome complex subunit 7a n=1 Tax=Trametes pubescens TaxID=154538 RepID=A0A1M2W080_TRAPU|nr:COP9 signalosome complex subunit 7a [Trametes pubescens]